MRYRVENGEELDGVYPDVRGQGTDYLLHAGFFFFRNCLKTHLGDPIPSFPRSASGLHRAFRRDIQWAGLRTRDGTQKLPTVVQIADTILKAIEAKGRQALPLENIYRHLYNPDLFLRAYGRIAQNAGATTQGITNETADGMSMEKINTLIEQFRCERYQWTPVKRTYVPKKNGKRRPLGIPIWSDRLVQEVMRSILEAYYEPQFSDLSHGFRINRGCHSALRAVLRWKDVEWFIEGDIKECFDSIDHDILLSILKEKIHDDQFTALIDRLLKAGYVEYGNHKPTLNGTPQGSTISPLLANIYLDKLDTFVAKTLIPRYTRSNRRTKYLQKTPFRPKTSTFRRLCYIRYADDFLIGFAGPREVAQEVKRRIKEFLQSELNLELSEEKTLITHAYLDSAQFLGHEVESIIEERTKPQKYAANELQLSVPIKAVKEKCELYKKHGKIVPRAELIKDSDYNIVSLFQSQYIGYIQYYVLAHNTHILNELRWVMEKSLIKTLAEKHKTSIRQLAKQCQKTIQTPYGTLRCFEMQVLSEKQPQIVRFGDTVLRRKRRPLAGDSYVKSKHTELIDRLLTNQCEYCGSMGRVEVHHIRKLADIEIGGPTPKPGWIQAILARGRKTLIVCKACHRAIHAGRRRALAAG